MERSGLRSHLSGSVPISIALHLVALLLFLIIPLTANMILPDPACAPARVHARGADSAAAAARGPHARAATAPAPNPTDGC